MKPRVLSTVSLAPTLAQPTSKSSKSLAAMHRLPDEWPGAPGESAKRMEKLMELFRDGLGVKELGRSLRRRCDVKAVLWSESLRRVWSGFESVAAFSLAAIPHPCTRRLSSENTKAPSKAPTSLPSF